MRLARAVITAEEPSASTSSELRTKSGKFDAPLCGRNPHLQLLSVESQDILDSN